MVFEPKIGPRAPDPTRSGDGNHSEPARGRTARMEPRHDRVILVEAPEIIMKILLDQMSNGWYDRLRHIGHDVYKVTELRDQGHDLQDDAAIGDYAKGNGMVLVTRDNKFAKYCKAMDIQHIHLDDDDLFKILRQKLDEYGDPTED